METFGRIKARSKLQAWFSFQRIRAGGRAFGFAKLRPINRDANDRDEKLARLNNRRAGGDMKSPAYSSVLRSEGDLPELLKQFLGFSGGPPLQRLARISPMLEGIFVAPWRSGPLRAAMHAAPFLAAPQLEIDMVCLSGSWAPQRGPSSIGAMFRLMVTQWRSVSRMLGGIRANRGQAAHFFGCSGSS